MAQKEGLPASLRVLVEEVAEKAVLQLYGPEGAPAVGTLFSQIEDVGVQMGDAVARAVIQRAVERQAATIPATTCRCGEPLKEPTVEPRVLITRRGEVGWNEPSGHCPRCRRAFFPSEPNVGPSRRGIAKPRGPSKDDPGGRAQSILRGSQSRAI